MLRRALALIALTATGAQADPCRLALVLGLDVSGSVDGAEYRAQLDGLATALTNPEVQAALLARPGAPVALSVFEWSGPDYQRPVLPWTELTGPRQIADAAEQIARTPRGTAPLSTAVGAAMAHGYSTLAQRPDCGRQVLDLSADGTSNTGPRPRDLPGPRAGVTVNALLVGDAPGLEDWFRTQVIRGPRAFIERADSYEDYGAAMRRKLLREISPMLLGAR